MLYFIFVLSVGLSIIALFFLLKRLAKPFLNIFDHRFALIVFIFSLICSGFLLTFISVQEISATENRNLEKWIPINRTNILNASNNIEKYVNDHFGLRDEFIKVYRFFQYNIFKKSLNDRVTKGRHGWFFSSRAIEVDCFTTSLTKENIERLNVIDKLESVQQFLNKKGIMLVIVIIPSKPYVYPEYLPRWIKGEQCRRTTIDNFEYLIENHTTIPILDLYDDLIKAKDAEKNILYYKGDTHWNSVGAYYGLKSISKFLIQNGISVNNIDFKNFHKEKNLYSGDLSRLYGVDIWEEANEYSLNINVSRNRILLNPSTRNSLGLDPKVNNWKALSASFSNIVDNSIGVPIIAADSYILSSKFMIDALFNRYYSMHFTELSESLPYIVSNHNNINVVVLSFLDSWFNVFIKEIDQWDAQSNYVGKLNGWEKELPW